MSVLSLWIDFIFTWLILNVDGLVPRSRARGAGGRREAGRPIQHRGDDTSDLADTSTLLTNYADRLVQGKHFFKMEGAVWSVCARFNDVGLGVPGDVFFHKRHLLGDQQAKFNKKYGSIRFTRASFVVDGWHPAIA